MIFLNDRGLSEIFDEHFINIIKVLDLKLSITSNVTNLPEIIEAFEANSRIRKTISLRGEEYQVRFHSVRENHTKKVILNMDKKR